ncbi:MAG: DUF2752 domain-containing protein [Pyrinomonadaceae bacterium]
MQAEQQIFNYKFSPTGGRLAAAAGAVAIVTGSGLLAYLDPVKASYFPVCPLYSLTGFACPGCGLTRGFHALFHGDAMTALDFNALIPVWVLIVVYIFVSLALFAVRGRGLPMRLVGPKVLLGFLIVLLLFGVLRNLPFYPFSVLYP